MPFNFTPVNLHKKKQSRANATSPTCPLRLFCVFFKVSVFHDVVLAISGNQLRHSATVARHTGKW